MKRLRLIAGLAVASLAAGCAGASAEAARRSEPRGEIVFYVADYAYRAAAFDDHEVAVGRMGGPSFSSLTLTPSGTWKGQVATFGPGGDPTNYAFKRESVGAGAYPSGLVELTVEGSRITGMGTDVTFTRVDGGFRISGLWMKDNVDSDRDPDVRARPATRVRRQGTWPVRSSVRTAALRPAGWRSGQPRGAAIPSDCPRGARHRVGRASESLMSTPRPSRQGSSRSGWKPSHQAVHVA